MHRTAPRLARLLACAAVPVTLVAGCSSGSAADDAQTGTGSTGASASASASGSSGSASASPSGAASAAVQAAAYDTLPEPCASIAKKTVEDLVPGTEDTSGKAGESSDATTRGSCTWNGLDDNGLKGSQYRWLDVSFLRFESDVSVGSADERAAENLASQVEDAQNTDGAKKVTSAPVQDLGDQATAVRYDLRKTDEDFKNQTVIIRTENVVVTLNYNGAGYAGAETPNADDLMKSAQKAAKEAVAAVAAANK
jgi:hypothetical protein